MSEGGGRRWRDGVPGAIQAIVAAAAVWGLIVGYQANGKSDRAIDEARVANKLSRDANRISSDVAEIQRASAESKAIVMPTSRATGMVSVKTCKDQSSNPVGILHAADVRQTLSVHGPHPVALTEAKFDGSRHYSPYVYARGLQISLPHVFRAGSRADLLIVVREQEWHASSEAAMARADELRGAGYVDQLHLFFDNGQDFVREIGFSGSVDESQFASTCDDLAVRYVADALKRTSATR